MNELLPLVLHRFRHNHQDVELHLFEMGQDEQVPALLDRRVHVGLSRAAINIDRLVEELLYQEPMMVAVPSDHPLADRSNIIIADMAWAPIIHYASGPACGVESEYLRTAFRDAGCEPNIAVESKNVESALGLVAAGLGIAVVGASFTHGKRPGVRFVRWGGVRPYVPMNAVYRMQEPSHLLHAFLAIVRDEAATLSGVAHAA